MLVHNPLSCTHQGILQDVPHQIWEGIVSASDAGLPLHLIRLLHNKPRYFLSNYTQCYLHYLSPKFFYDQLGLLGLSIFVILSIWFFHLIKRKHYRLPLLVLILYPLIMLFELYRLL